MKVKELTDQGIIPFAQDVHDGKATPSQFFPALMGQAAGGVTEVKSAQAIVDELMVDALEVLSRSNAIRCRL